MAPAYTVPVQEQGAWGLILVVRFLCGTATVSQVQHHTR